MCPKSFASHVQLSRHNAMVHRIRKQSPKYKCNKCTRVYVYKAYYKQHQAHVHGKKKKPKKSKHHSEESNHSEHDKSPQPPERPVNLSKKHATNTKNLEKHDKKTSTQSIMQAQSIGPTRTVLRHNVYRQSMYKETSSETSNEVIVND